MRRNLGAQRVKNALAEPGPQRPPSARPSAEPPPPRAARIAASNSMMAKEKARTRSTDLSNSSSIRLSSAVLEIRFS